MKREKIRKFGHHFFDTLEDHPFEIALSAALVLFGIKSIVTNLSATPGSIQALPTPLAAGYCLLAIVGGGGVICGLMFRTRLTWAYGLERMGLFVSASAWGSYIVGLLLSPITGAATLLILALGGLAAGCFFRARAVNRKAKFLRLALQRAIESNEEAL